MCGGGNPPAAAQPTYTAVDGTSFADPNAAQDHNRQLQLAATMGYSSAGGQSFSDWQAANPTFAQYNAEGLTGADYQNQQAVIQQQQQAAAAAAQQASNIAASESAINSTFSNYDSNYYNNIANTVSSYYQPQLDNQFQDAQKNLAYKFANQGNTNSSAYTGAQAELNQQDQIQSSGVANQAQDAATAAEENVSSAESKLNQEAQTGADPATVNTDLNNEDSELKAYTPSLTPLGQVFTNYLTPVVNGVGSAVAGYQQGQNTALFNNSSGASTATYGQS